MRPTARVIKFALRLTLGLFFAWVVQAAEVGPEVLDLTKQTVPAKSLGVPGQSVGGYLGQQMKRGHELPVHLEIDRFRLKGGSVSLEIQLANSGDSSLEVPSCLDGLKAFSSGAANRRSMEFGLTVDSPSGTIFEPIEVTFGSSRPECLTQIEPKHALLVILEAPLPERVAQIGKEVHHFSVRAFVAETTFEDDRYYIKDRSDRIVSQPVDVSF